MADFLHELTQCEARLHAAEQERDAFKQSTEHYQGALYAQYEMTKAAEKRCAVLTEAIQQAMALTGTSTAHYHVLAAALAATAPAEEGEGRLVRVVKKERPPLVIEDDIRSRTGKKGVS